MIQPETESENVPVNPNDQSSKPKALERLSESLTKVFSNSLEAADAQFAISALKTSRTAILVAGVILAFLALTAVCAYGFFLLDGCLAYALGSPSLPIWFAPLIRGLVYVFSTACAFAYLWHTYVGFDSNLKKAGAD